MTDERPTSPIEDVETQFAVLFATSRRMLNRTAATVHPDLHPSGMFLMRMLEKRGPLRPSVIAEHLDVDRSAVSRLIAFVERLGLVTRIADPQDKRAYTVELTDDGRSRLGTLSVEQTGPLRILLRDWPQDDIETFARLLARLNEGLST
jgi:DNA-binding MarR family transcriptional regulator